MVYTMNEYQLGKVEGEVDWNLEQLCEPFRLRFQFIRSFSFFLYMQIGLRTFLFSYLSLSIRDQHPSISSTTINRYLRDYLLVA